MSRLWSVPSNHNTAKVPRIVATMIPNSRGTHGGIPSLEGGATAWSIVRGYRTSRAGEVFRRQPSQDHVRSTNRTPRVRRDWIPEE